MSDAPQLERLPDDDESALSESQAQTQPWTLEEAPSPAPPVGRNFEELTLAETLGLLLRAPGETWGRLRDLLAAPRHTAPSASSDRPVMAASDIFVSRHSLPSTAAAPADTSARPSDTLPQARASAWRLIARLVFFVFALVFAWSGTRTMVSGGFTREESVQLVLGLPLLVFGFVLWLGGELVGDPPRWLARALGQNLPDSATPQKHTAEAEPEPLLTLIHPARVIFAGLGLLCSLLALGGTVNNLFTFQGVAAWWASIVLWVAACAPRSWRAPFVSGAWIRSIENQMRVVRWRGNWVLVALLLIMALGAYYRLYALADAPPEMTSDAVEKLLDSNRVLQGTTQVFFPNNGGREPIQMYLMALLAQFPGQGMNFTSLKLLTAIEGILTLPILFWFGREMIGREHRTLGNIVGLCVAALVAVSAWHEILSRMGLRIVLTVPFTALLLLFLVRGMRENRRGPFILAGLTLGSGLYAYQAVRMLPVVVIVGVLLALIATRGWQARLRLLFNSATLVLIAFVVFVPLFGFSIQYPDDFWRRTAGRLLGDDIIQTTNEQGQIVERQATFEERMAAFQSNLPVLMNNIRDALLMFNWKGDIAWISNIPNAPQMDALSGALFVLGIAAWLARALRRRDVGDWLMPLALFIMLLPSALSIAYTVENPSATRTSGTIPTAYLFAGVALAALALALWQALPRVAKRAALLVPLAAIVLIYNTNFSAFFDTFRTSYVLSSLPYSDAGRVLRGFVDSGGAFGNAFMIGYPFWWDHRAIGIEAGRIDWPNGIDTNIVSVPDFLRDSYECRQNAYRLDPNRDLLFFVSPEDTATQESLQQWFPNGYGVVNTTYQPGDVFYLFRVPAPGPEAITAFLQNYSSGPRC